LSESDGVPAERCAEKPHPFAQNAKRTGHPVVWGGESMGQLPHLGSGPGETGSQRKISHGYGCGIDLGDGNARLASLIRSSVRISIAIAVAAVLVGWTILSTLWAGLGKIQEPERQFVARHSDDPSVKSLGLNRWDFQNLSTVSRLQELYGIHAGWVRGHN
jgi:hypothetical protein